MKPWIKMAGLLPVWIGYWRISANAESELGKDSPKGSNSHRVI